MIIGGGFGQLPAIKASKHLGLFIHVVDGKENAPGMIMGNKAHVVDIIKIKDIVELAKRYSIDGVLTLQSDVGVPAVGAVVDALGLSGNGIEVSNRCSNKILMRKRFDLFGVPQPKFFEAKSVDQAIKVATKIGFPCVIKAPDSSGSRGVTKVNFDTDVKEAFNAAKQHTFSGEVIVEEFISGIEVGAQAFSINGECVITLVHEDILSPPPYMIPIGHAFPSSLDVHKLAKVSNIIKCAVNALGIKDGPSNVDLIVDDSGNPKIIEIGARVGATCLPELLHYHTGIDWVLQSINASMGNLLDLTLKEERPCAAFIIEVKEDGILKGFQLPAEMRDHPDVLEWEITASIGDKVSRLRKGTDRIGKVITTGRTKNHAINLAKQFRDSIIFDISPIAQ